MTEDDDNIVSFPGKEKVVREVERKDVVCPAKNVFEGAMNQDGLVRGIAIGVAEDGSVYFALNDRQIADAFLLLERAKHMLLHADI